MAFRDIVLYSKPINFGAIGQAILHLWFTPKQHFTKDAALDEAIRTRFGATLEAAAKCELFAWRATPEGRLAEIVVLDQFSRNVYRDTLRAFAQDALALVLAQELVASGQDLSLSVEQRIFAYMPYCTASPRWCTPRPWPCLRSRVWKTTWTTNCATKPSSTASAATPTATPCRTAALRRKSWFS